MATSDRRDRLERAGQWLRRARIRAGHETGGSFARELGVDPSAVSNYERGASQVPDERAEQIADVLGIDVINVRRGLGLWTPEPPEHDEQPRDELAQRPGESDTVYAERLIERGLELLRHQRGA